MVVPVVLGVCLTLVVHRRRLVLVPSSPFRPTSGARGRDGWCCVVWVLCGRHPVRVPLIVVVALVVPVVSWSWRES